MKRLFLKQPKRLKGFTLLQLAMVVVIISFLVGLALVYYRIAILKSENTEALINLRAITKAEEDVLYQGGTYINVSDTEEAEEKLELGLGEKIFEYRVEDATESNYTAIAERKEPPIMIAMGPEGSPMFFYKGEGGGYTSAGPGYTFGGGGYSGPGGGYGGTGGGIGGGIGGLGGGYTGGSGGSSNGSSDGSSGGSSGGGGTGGPPGPVSGEDTGSGSGGATNIICGDGVCEGTESCNSCALDCGECPTGGGAIVDAALMDAYNALKNSSSGGALGALLDNYNVVITVGNGHGAIAYWSPSQNKIVVDVNYAASWTTGAIAAVLAHEANHAYYTYDPDYWITETLTRHPELSESDLHIDQSEPTQYPWNSIDQEYNSFKKEAEVWNELKDASNSELDYVSWLLAQGEAVAKARIREVYGPQGLPEY
ncbi:MAG: hypothetical protein ABIA97_03995 [Candidatus Omnitrophota bacterium]